MLSKAPGGGQDPGDGRGRIALLGDGCVNGWSVFLSTVVANVAD